MATIRHIKCQVKKITFHSDNVYSLDLIPEKRLPKFKPGQFCHLAIDEYDPTGFWPESRAFSIASSPEERSLLKLTYSAIGSFTNRMVSSIKEDDTVWIKLPYGEFTINPDKDTVVIAGGTGITAFTAYLSQLNENSPHKTLIAYGAKSIDLLIYHDLVKDIVKNNNNIEAQFYSESSIEDCMSEHSNIKYLEGFIDINKIVEKVSDKNNTLFYIAGPPIMIETISTSLLALSISNKNIIIDNWS